MFCLSVNYIHIVFAVYNYASKDTVLSNYSQRNLLVFSFYPIQFHPLAANNLLYTYESQFGVVETMARIEQTLKNMGIPVFAKFEPRPRMLKM